MTSRPVPTVRTLIFLLLTLWQIIAGGVRVFFWDSFKTGLIDIRPLGRVARLLTVSGLLLVFGYLFSILFSDLLRTYTPLDPLTFESSTARGLLVPSPVIPLTLITMTLAWSYVLTGALHVRRPVRWLVLVLYILFGFMGLAEGALGIAPGLGAFGFAPMLAIFLVILVVLLAAFMVLPQRALPLAIEFIFMLGLQTILAGVGLLQAVTAQQRSGFPYVSGYLLTTSLDLARTLILPFFIISGSEMGNFARDFAGWMAKSVQRYAAPRLLGILLTGFLTLRWFGQVRSIIEEGVAGRQWAAWAGAALLVAGISIVYLWRQRQSGAEAVPSGLVVQIAVLSQLFQIALGPLLVLIAFVFTLASVLAMLSGNADLPALQAQANQVIGMVGSASTLYRQYVHLIIAIMGLAAAWLARQRAQPTIAAFGLILAWAQVLEWLMERGRPLWGLRYQYADVDVILLAVITIATIIWLRDTSRRASGSNDDDTGDQRALHLLALAFLGWVLTQTSFLDNPFSPFFAFAGVFFLVFGILWGVLTAGGKFANTGTPDYPRLSRLLLYIGYVLLSVTISHWFIVSHNVEAQALQSGLTLNGFRIYGLALAYLVFVEAGKPLFENS